MNQNNIIQKNCWKVSAVKDAVNRTIIYDYDLDIVCLVLDKIDPKTDQNVTGKNADLIAAAPEMLSLLSETLIRLDAVLLLDQNESIKVLALKNKIFNLLQVLNNKPVNLI